MFGLLIQHARWQGELVMPDDIRLETGAKCDCVCIGCGEPLILRRGEKKRWHFAHRAKTSCGGESYIHKVVKAWTAEKLIGQTIPLPPHPELDSPQGFCVESGWQEESNKDVNRRYDVVLEGVFLYKNLAYNKTGKLIFEVCYSSPKDDDFKLHTQKEKNYALETDAKVFYGDGQADFNIQRLMDNSGWIWFTDNQKLWVEYGLKNSVRDIVANWITQEFQGYKEVIDSQLTPLDPEWKPYPKKQPYTCYRHFGAEDKHGSSGPLKDYGFYLFDFMDRNMGPPLYFDAEKCWKNRYSKKTGRIYDIVFQGDFVGRSVNRRKKSCLVFQLVDRLGEHSDDFKQQIREAKFCVLEVDIHGFFSDGLKPPDEGRLMENSQWVW